MDRQKHAFNERETEYYDSIEDEGRSNDYDNAEDNSFKPWPEDDKEEEYEILKDLVDEEERDSSTRFKQMSQKEREALLNDRSIKGKQVDIT